MNFTMVIADDEPLVLKSMEMFVAKTFPHIQVTGVYTLAAIFKPCSLYFTG